MIETGATRQMRRKAMSIVVKGREWVRIDSGSLGAVFEVGRAVGWVPKYVRPEDTGLQEDDVVDIPQHNARALATALYRVIHMIETDSLSESLVELVKEAGVGNMRAVADVAYVDTFYIDYS
jgi:hypothetical protein